MNIEKAKEIHSSVLWTEICGEIDIMIKALESKLRNCSVEGLQAIQIEIQSLEKIKRLPQDVIDREE